MKKKTPLLLSIVIVGMISRAISCKNNHGIEPKIAEKYLLSSYADEHKIPYDGIISLSGAAETE